jgi:hypothetical protein
MKMLASFLIADCVEQLPATPPVQPASEGWVSGRARRICEVQAHIGHSPGEVDVHASPYWNSPCCN